MNIFEYFKKKGIDTLDSSFYSKIALWDSWYRSNVKKFHQYRVYHGASHYERCVRKSLGMAKKICEDISDLLLNERVTITIKDETTAKYVRSVLDAANFTVQGNEYQERKAACGTVAYVPYLTNTELDDQGRIISADVKLDYVVASHRHNDHIGAMTSQHGPLYNFEIGQIYSTGILNSGSSNPAALEGVANKLNIPNDYLAKGDTLDIGDVHIEILWPQPGQVKTSTSSTEDCNNGSLVMRFDYGETSALFTGDLYKSGEIQMIKDLGDDVAKLDVDVLKIPHHGRQTSSSSDLIKAVTPKVAMSTGAIIMEPTIYAQYAKQGAATYMDVYDGYVKVTMDGTNVTTQCSRDRGVIEAYEKFDKAFGIQH